MTVSHYIRDDAVQFLTMALSIAFPHHLRIAFPHRLRIAFISDEQAKETQTAQSGNIPHPSITADSEVKAIKLPDRVSLHCPSITAITK